MGISITSPSQIPVNVVEIGNEISQNAINAIAAAQLPSTGNPIQTLSAAAALVNQSAVNKQNTPSVSWGFPFPIPTNLPLALLNGSWVPLAAFGTTVGEDFGASTTRFNSYNFDFTDGSGNYVPLSGSSAVGLDNVTYYYANGNYDGNIQSGTTSTNYPATGPNYTSDWSGPENSVGFYDNSYNYVWKYVYRDGSGGFYTADNPYNPPY